MLKEILYNEEKQRNVLVRKTHHPFTRGGFPPVFYQNKTYSYLRTHMLLLGNSFRAIVLHKIANDAMPNHAYAK